MKVQFYTNINFGEGAVRKTSKEKEPYAAHYTKFNRGGFNKDIIPEYIIQLLN